MIAVIHAHPYPKRSRAGRALLDSIRTLPEVEVRTLYDLYPDFDIDVPAEQDVLARSSTIVLLHPFYWYSVPGLLKHWLDKVFERGWAYGDGGTALAGKACLWVTTVGGDASTYAACGSPESFCDYVAPLAQWARMCGLAWQEPFVVFDADRIADDALAEAATRVRAQVASAAGLSPAPVAAGAGMATKVPA